MCEKEWTLNVTHKTYESTQTRRCTDAWAALHILHTIQYNGTFKFQGTFWLVAFFIFERFFHFTAIYKQYIALVMWNKTWTKLLLANQQRLAEGEKIDGIYVCVCCLSISFSRWSSNSILAARPFLTSSLTRSLVHPAAVHLPSSFSFMWLDSFLFWYTKFAKMRTTQQHTHTHTLKCLCVEVKIDARQREWLMRHPLRIYMYIFVILYFLS